MRVQTFLPSPSFAESAAVLDDRRLGKQRVEVLQILRALHLEGYGWQGHPAVLMWRGCTRALVAYGLAVVAEWTARGHRDATAAAIAEFTSPQPAVDAARLPADERPPWLGWAPLHRSYQAALVRKDPQRYRALFPDVPADLPYAWPPPPAAAPAAEPLAAWVVRAVSPRQLVAFRDGGVVGVPAAFGADGDTPKRRRQRQRLCRDAAWGDRVVVPAGDDLHLGVLAGPVEERTVDGAALLVRPVRWWATVPRAALRRPYQLQDPQLVFALRGEPALAVARGAAAGA